MRLFVALDVPESVRQSLSEAVAPLRKLCRGARWVHLEGAHVTLKFIGEVSPDQAARIEQALASIRAAAFDLRFAGFGFFPNERHPRVLWAGIEAQNTKGPALPALAAAIEAALVPLGIPRESREFRAHFTLARFASPEGPEDLDRLRAALDERAAAGATDFGAARASEFYLYRSVLKPAGAEYTRLAAYPLSGESAL